MSIWKSDLPHYRDRPPGACMCADCRAILRRDYRCPFIGRDPNDRRRKFQCGDYKGHREKEHTVLIATTFLP